MKFNICKKLKRRIKDWLGLALPGLLIITLVLIVHLTGLLQPQEWMAFDHFLRWRPTEAFDPRVVIVGIDEEDIKYVGGYPIPDKDLAKMLMILQTYQPRVIGVDLYRDPTTNPDHAYLLQALREIPNIIGVEVALNRL